MSATELDTLTELVEQFRRRAKTAQAARDGYRQGMALDNLHEYREGSIRCEGKRQAYSNAADDLERFIRSAQPAEPGER